MERFGHPIRIGRAPAGQLWRIDRNGRVTLLESGMGTANGIEVSPDGRTLYVNETVQRNVWAYDIQPDGSLKGKRLLIRFPDFGMDGMRCDVDGNLYISRHGKGTVAVVRPRQGDSRDGRAREEPDESVLRRRGWPYLLCHRSGERQAGSVPDGQAGP